MALVKEMRAAFGSKYGLPVTLPTSDWYLQHFNVKGLQDSVDWFNFMTVRTCLVQVSKCFDILLLRLLTSKLRNVTVRFAWYVPPRQAVESVSGELCAV